MANAETVEQVCDFFYYRLNAKGCFGSPFVSYAHKHGDNDTLVVYIRKTFNEFNERVMAALKREILVERDFADAHIFSLLEIIDKRDVLIKELADELDKNSSQYCGHYGCDDCEGKDGCKTYELIKKAREVVK